jgi:hypothetical protein
MDQQHTHGVVPWLSEWIETRMAARPKSPATNELTCASSWRRRGALRHGRVAAAGARFSPTAARPPGAREKKLRKPVFETGGRGKDSLRTEARTDREVPDVRGGAERAGRPPRPVHGMHRVARLQLHRVDPVCASAVQDDDVIAGRFE